MIIRNTAFFSLRAGIVGKRQAYIRPKLECIQVIMLVPVTGGPCVLHPRAPNCALKCRVDAAAGKLRGVYTNTPDMAISNYRQNILEAESKDINIYLNGSVNS